VGTRVFIGRVTEVKEEQLLNALSPILVSEDGNVIEPKEMQPEKARLSIELRPDTGSMRVVKLIQFSNNLELNEKYVVIIFG